MKKTAMVLALTGALGITSAAQATLLPRLGGQAYYDTDLNITWLADANYAQTSGYDADGLMDWNTAMTWANNLVYDGLSGWRLPTAQQPDFTCSVQQGGYSSGYYCTGSEMGYMFYTNLGGIAGTAISVTHNANYSLFSNIQDEVYWSGTLAGSGAGVFLFLSGAQSDYLKGNEFYAWAVRDGDVAAAVPEPATALLFGVGAMGLGLSRRWNRR